MKVGRFKKVINYQANVDMTDEEQDLFERVGREVLTRDQIINIGFNHSLMRGLQTLQLPKKRRAKAKR